MAKKIRKFVKAVMGESKGFGLRDKESWWQDEKVKENVKNKCTHFWTFLCTCSRWTFPGRLEGKANASFTVFVVPCYFVPPFDQ